MDVLPRLESLIDASEKHLRYSIDDSQRKLLQRINKIYWHRWNISRRCNNGERGSSMAHTYINKDARHDVSPDRY
jgi:hypothetical protein